MAFLGDLLIRLRAETADFQSDMGKAAYVAEKNMRQIQRAASTLFAIIGAGSFVAMVKGSIDAADKLNDLSKTTDISVEKLSGLRVAAKQSGGDLDSIAASVSKLSVNIGKDGDKFKALGITAKEPLEAFKQLADVFVSIQDPQLRAAVAAQALGKSWQGAVPLLAEGGKKIGEMVDRGSELSGVTKEMAEEADKFNDKLTELTGTGGLMIRLVGPMLPLLNSLAEDMLKASEKTDGLNSSIKPLAKTFKPLAETLKTVIILGANVSFVFETMGKDLSRLAENIKLIATGNFAGSRALGEMFRKDAEAARKALDEYEKKILGLGLTGNTVPTAPADGKNASAAAARARAFVDGADKKGKTDPYMTPENMAKRRVEADEYWAKEREELWTFIHSLELQGYAEERKLSEKELADQLASIEARWNAAQEYADGVVKGQNDVLNASKKTNEIGKELGLTFSSAFEDAIVNGKKFQDVLRGIAQDILRIIARKTITEPMAAAVSGAFGAFNFGSFFGTQAPAPVEDRILGQAATGMDYVPRTGLYRLHQGEAVLTAAENGQGGGIVFATTINIDSRTDAATIARTVDGAMRQSEARQIALLNQGGGALYHAVRRA